MKPTVMGARGKTKDGNIICRGWSIRVAKDPQWPSVWFVDIDMLVGRISVRYISMFLGILFYINSMGWKIICLGWTVFQIHWCGEGPTMIIGMICRYKHAVEPDKWARVAGWILELWVTYIDIYRAISVTCMNHIFITKNLTGIAQCIMSSTIYMDHTVWAPKGLKSSHVLCSWNINFKVFHMSTISWYLLNSIDVILQIQFPDTW